MTTVTKAPVTNGKAETAATVEGKTKRTPEELKKMGVVGGIILLTKKAVKLAKANKFEGLGFPADMEAKDAEDGFYKLHKSGGIYERMDQTKEPFAKLRELAKKALPDMQKYNDLATDAIKKASYSANVKAFLKYAAEVEPEKRASSLDMSDLAGIEL